MHMSWKQKSKKISKKYLKRVQKFFIYLQSQGIVSFSTFNIEDTIQAPLSDFRIWLDQNRGLAEATINKYERLVHKLLPDLGKDPSLYNAKIIKKVIFNQALQYSLPQVKTIITALRSYLKFLTTKGICQANIINSVPTIPEWRLSSMPTYLDENSVELIIKLCDKKTNHGVRDRAILLLLYRLALRAGDIINMNIDDLDWINATVRVKGKGRKEILLPLPQDVGDAIIDYLKVRPKVSISKIFLCANAPYRAIAKSASISDIVRTALSRAGIDNISTKGSNLLRHTAATIMLRNGATLETISAVLRHQSTDMSAYYAKVDIKMLNKITQPWPGGEPCCEKM